MRLTALGLLLIYLFERQSRRGLGEERERYLPFSDLLPKWFQQPGLGYFEARSQELPLGLSQGLSTWAVLCHLPGYSSRTLAQTSEPEAALNYRSVPSVD